MRRRVTTYLEPGRAKRAVGHGRHRALAVRACDENAFEMGLGAPEGSRQRGDIREAEFDAELLERQEVLKRFHIRVPPPLFRPAGWFPSGAAPGIGAPWPEWLSFPAGPRSNPA